MSQGVQGAVLQPLHVDAVRKATSLARKTELLLAAVVFVFSIVAWLVVGLVFSLTFAIALSSASAASIILSFAAFMLVLLLGPVALVRAITPAFERWQLARVVQSGAMPPDVTAYDFVRVSPYAIVVPPLLMLPLGVLLAASRGQLAMITAPLGIYLLVFAFVYHRIPNCRRSMKYATFMLGSSLLNTSILFAKGGPSDFGTLLWVLGMLSWCIVFAIVRRRIRPEDPIVPGEASTLRAISSHRSAMSLGPGPGGATIIWYILRLIPILGDIVWSGRICSKERLAKAPVLYLRSFHNAATASVLGKAVTPAIGRSCILVSLVHPSQTGSALGTKTHPAWATTVFGVGNDQWQEWYVRQLSLALAVVVDATLITPATRWELETAHRTLGRDRVAVIAPAGEAQNFPGFLVFEYPPERPRDLEGPLSQWISWVVSSLLGARAA